MKNLHIVHNVHNEPTFADLQKAYPRTSRTKPAAAKAKWDAIISEEGLHTRNRDEDSGTFVDVHLKATPQEIIEAARLYRQEMQLPESYKYSEYTQGLQNWLNQGKWMNY